MTTRFKMILVLAAVAMAFLQAGCASLLSADDAVAPYRPQVKRVAAEAVRTPPAAMPAKAEAVPGRKEDVGVSGSGRILRSGDRLQITIYAPPEPFTCTHVIDEQGRVNLPLIGAMQVAGKSCADAQQVIEKQYIDEKYYKVVTVIIVPPESEYSLAGEVLRPGPYPLTRNLTVLQALGRGGRFTEYADPTKIRLIRGSEIIPVNADEIRKGRQQDIVVIPGDVIEVPRTWY